MQEVMKNQTPTQGAQTSQVDAHLVMNVLNQLAANEYKAHGTENALLFALSDYLSEAFRLLGQNVLPCGEALRLLQAHVGLTAHMRRAEIYLDVPVEAAGALRLEHGLLTALADCLIKGAKPQFGGHWRLQLALGAADGHSQSGLLQVSIGMTLIALDPATQSLDVSASQRRLKDFFAAWLSRGYGGTYDLEQKQADRLQLQCVVQAGHA